MTVNELLKRARSALGKKVKYRLGAGGIDPKSPTPASVDNACDCSGFVCWCLGISRKTDHPLYVRFNGGWINTDAIVHDANSPTGFFRKIPEPKVGCLIVFPSKKPRRPYGHVGIVTEVREGKVTKVIHCSSGNFRRHGDAIKETPPTVFQVPDTIFVWFEGIEV
ncbi:CHAP domain-containing protein [Candidatus Fervidibacteria bacterium JGI MDM2 SSWTFF-3-K9]